VGELSLKNIGWVGFSRDSSLSRLGFIITYNDFINQGNRPVGANRFARADVVAGLGKSDHDDLLRQAQDIAGTNFEA
jgi:hypothetical protein